jgi:ketosteroid isomerase-like protein
MSAETEVRAASERFYAALNRMIGGDASSMQDIWSQSATVTTMHPIGGREVGREQVLGSFRKVAELAQGGEVKLTDAIVQVSGDVGYELGTERGQIKIAGQQAGLEHRVTNIYRKENGAWVIVHHHTDLSPTMLDIVHRLQGKK